MSYPDNATEKVAAARRSGRLDKVIGALFEDAGVTDRLSTGTTVYASQKAEAQALVDQLPETHRPTLGTTAAPEARPRRKLSDALDGYSTEKVLELGKAVHESMQRRGLRFTDDGVVLTDPDTEESDAALDAFYAQFGDDES